MNLLVRNLSDQLLELIRDQILSGKVGAEGPVRQDALAAEFGVSKIPLREALARLEEEGLLRSHANRGYFVRPMSAEEATEVFDLRILIEPETIALAAARATDEDQEIARATLARLNEAMNEGGEGAGSFNRAFHLALIRPSGRSATITILERLHILSERYVRKHLEPLGRDERANEEHRQMLDLWLRRDGAGAASFTLKHIENTLKDLTVQLNA